MSRIDYYDDGNIVFKYEVVDNIAIIHCDVKYWKLSVLKLAYKEFGDYLQNMKLAGIYKVVTYTKQPKLVKAFGGISMGFIIMGDEEYEVYECLL